ncbi:MAG: ribonuclease HI [Pseudomonadota bacterium]
MSSRVVIYTDGACRGNPGPGGWGATLQSGEYYRELKGFARSTTNNRMELEAAINALAALKRSSDVDLYTDSTYVRNGVTSWLQTWKTNNWKTAARKPVKNRELWEQLDTLQSQHDINWHWVKGHSGDAGNDRVDELANEAIDELGDE